MKRLIIALAAIGTLASAANAQTYVNGYTKSNGTYVAPYYRSSPNSTTLDNYSTRGNINPYTGAVGTRNPYPTTTYQPYQPYRPYKAPCYINC